MVGKVDEAGNVTEGGMVQQVMDGLKDIRLKFEKLSGLPPLPDPMPTAAQVDVPEPSVTRNSYKCDPDPTRRKI